MPEKNRFWDVRTWLAGGLVFVFLLGMMGIYWKWFPLGSAIGEAAGNVLEGMAESDNLEDQFMTADEWEKLNNGETE